MRKPSAKSAGVGRTIHKSASLVVTCGALLWSACGQTEGNAAADSSASSAVGGSGGTSGESVSSTSDGSMPNSDSTGTPTSTTSSASTASATTGVVEPGSGGAPTTATTGPGAAGADPSDGAGAGGTGGTVDDDCEVVTFDMTEDTCRVETRCPEFVQHTNCRASHPEQWQCDTDEHDNSRPHTIADNPGWMHTVTGTSEAAVACDAVVAVNLKRPSVMLSDVEDCSEFSDKTNFSLTRSELCGPRYLASSGAAVWDGLPASVSCSESDDGLGQSCTCSSTGVDDGDYDLDAADIESALTDVWEFCTNSSAHVPLEQSECGSSYESVAADGACHVVAQCLLAVTDDSGLELDQQVYQEVLCDRETVGAALTCTCRLGPDRRFEFSPASAQGASACDALESVCDARNTVERAEGPAECERGSAIVGRNWFLQRYHCQIPISLGGTSGVALESSSLQCTENPDGGLSCNCRDAFNVVTMPLAPTSKDFAVAWELAVFDCEALLEAAPAEP